MDLFEIRLDEDVVTRIQVRGIGTGFNCISLAPIGPNPDLYVRVFDSNGFQVSHSDLFGAGLAFDDNSGGGGNADLTFKPLFTDSYWIGVSGYPNTTYDPKTFDAGTVNGALGNYELIWSRPHAVDDSTTLLESFGASSLNFSVTFNDVGVSKVDSTIPAVSTPPTIINPVHPE